MKTQILSALLAASLISSARAQQSSAAPAAVIPAANIRSTAQPAGSSEEIAKLRDELEQLRLKYTDTHPQVVQARQRLERVENAGRYSQRLASVVRRADTGLLPGSIILNGPIATPTAEKGLDELSEDLAVLNFIFNRNLEKVFGDKAAEYRLGVPITLRGDNRLIETTYIQTFGVLIKIHVPFPVWSTGNADKTTEKAPSPDNEWERARHAVYGDTDAPPPGVATGVPYDENLVNELKKQIFESLKNAANVRHLQPGDAIAVAVLGGPNAPKASSPGEAAELNRSTALMIRISKSQADAVTLASQGANQLAKEATLVGYFESPTVTTRVYNYSAYPAAYGAAR
jgi:hypothetical protein